MARVAMGDVWDDTRAFVAREASLLFPLSLATIGIAALLWSLAVPEPNAAGQLPPGRWMLVLAPVMLLLLFGALSISALVLRPGASVGDALGAAVHRLGGGLTAMLLVGAVTTAGMVLATLLATLVGPSNEAAVTLSMLIILPAFLWLTVRLAALMPQIADLPPTLAVLPVVRRAFALTKGHAGAIAWVALAWMIASALVSSALHFGLGSLLRIAAIAAGVPAAGPVLADVVLAATVAVLQGSLLVFQAMLYRRLAARG